MSTEVHVYTLGKDPYALQVGEILFVIHQGEPNSPVIIPTPPSGTYFTPTPLGGTYANYIMAPRDAEQFNAILGAQHGRIDLGVALNRADASGPEMRAICEGALRHEGGDVAVHVVSLDALDEADHND